MRCGSILPDEQRRCGHAGSDVIQIYPPRMPAWRKPFRGTMRWLRGWHVMPERSPASRIRRGLDPILSDSMVGLVLSVIPGLAHLLKRRFREVGLLVALWFAVLCAGLFFYGSQIGSLLIGLAIGIHAWIAIQYGLFKEIEGFMERIGAVLIVVVLLAVLYWAVPRFVPGGLTGGHTALTIPAMNVHAGDYFLVRRLGHGSDPLPRGTLVLTQPEGYRNYHQDRVLNQRQRMIGQVVGLPGETIQVVDHAYVADGQRLDPSRFPVPRWLQRYATRSGIFIPARSYFVSSEYTVGGHGNLGLTNQMIGNACILGASGIRGRAFMHWWPLSRRGFIE